MLVMMQKCLFCHT